MAAGGAAGRPLDGSLKDIPASWLVKRLAPAGNLPAVTYRATYPNSGGYAYYPGTQAIRVKGPGTLNSLEFDTFGIVTVGFQIASVKAGSGAQLVSLSSTNVGWVTAQAFSGFGTNPKYPAALGSFSGAWVWPIQEIINNGNTQYYYDDPAGGGTYQALVELYATSQGLAVGQLISFESSFANGYTTIVALGNFTQSSTTYYVGVPQSIHYTLYSPIAYDDELIINVSPLISPGGVAGTVNPNSQPLAVNLTASISIGGS